MTQKVANAKIKHGDGREHIEPIWVSSEAAAESEIKEIVQRFNDSLKPGEQPRAFVSIESFYDEPVKEEVDYTGREATCENCEESWTVGDENEDDDKFCPFCDSSCIYIE